MIEKLELKHLAGYLPYNLGMTLAANTNLTYTLCSLVYNNSCFVSGIGLKQWIIAYKPILHTLSDLTKPCLEGGKIPIVELAKLAFPAYGSEWRLSSSSQFAVIRTGFMIFELDEGYNCFLLDNSAQMDQLELFEKLYEWHFNVHNLPEHLFVDINTFK